MLTSRSGGKMTSILRRVPLLTKLTDEDLRLLAGALVDKKFKKGELIIKQGDAGHGFYIVKAGTVVVTRINEKKIECELGKLKSGDYFGETALINNSKRGASVRAIEPVTCFYLQRKNFEQLFGKNKLNVQFAKRKAISAEKTLSYQPKVPENAVKTKSDAVKRLILSAVQDNVLFMNLDYEHKLQIVKEMYRTEIKKGVSAIEQGALGDNLYVVQEGSFDIFVNGKKVAIRGAGTCFGELALMYNSRRAATVTASRDSVVWVIDRFTFRRIVTNLSEKKFGQYVDFLKKVELLVPLADYERQKVAEALEEVSYPANTTIFTQGAVGDAMYIVYSGEVTATKKNDKLGEHVVARLREGDCFGERALLKKEPRAATITSTSAVQLLKLDSNAFTLLLGPLEDILMNKVASYELVKPEKGAGGGDDNILKIPFNDLKIKGTLGKGSFGHVTLVQDKNTGETYALKAVSKAQIVQTGQQGHIMSEKRVMTQLQHPFLVRLFQTYKDQHRLYFLLELSLGGELFSVLREKTLFAESTARFYAASVVSAFQYMHEKDIIYRDLKPENLLLDQEGFLKVTDFGFAKDISSGRTWTLCGTPDYLAPEIVSGKGHGKGVDWWTLGVFVYEMLASYPPFYDDDPMKTYAKIMHGNITFPSHFSKEAVSLVKKLLHHKPTKRLGVVKGGAKLIKKHPWFKNFSFDDLFNKKISPPIIPVIKSNLDISNFDEYPEEDEDFEPYEDDGTNWDSDF